ncbi:hypothetical protein JAAARDRAFT_40744 [Jaapia argillacea MUCL 33604]|uniref:Uncharacterized protein n=1 Tax=Jaapia argillacea MUCL 33604 TaxID=933084 RepID=A0A067PNM6_9AGAM|nr:hypothetical protein JAAARDRAFT_40744 [Jaapia argillacea MUCL 33604]
MGIPHMKHDPLNCTQMSRPMILPSRSMSRPTFTVLTSYVSYPLAHRIPRILAACGIVSLVFFIGVFLE